MADVVENRRSRCAVFLFAAEVLELVSSEKEATTGRMLMAAPSLPHLAPRPKLGGGNSRSRRFGAQSRAFIGEISPVSPGRHRGCKGVGYDFALAYVDELVAYTVKNPRHAAVRYFTSSNSLYSIAATMNTSGTVVERYSYNAYGVRTVKNSTGATLAKTAVNQDRGFTGLINDSESSQRFSRTRYFSNKLQRFTSREPWCAIDNHRYTSNYSFLAVDSSWRDIILGQLIYAEGGYLDGRYSLYDFVKNNPSNLVEPYSTANQPGPARESPDFSRETSDLRDGTPNPRNNGGDPSRLRGVSTSRLADFLRGTEDHYNHQNTDRSQADERIRIVREELQRRGVNPPRTPPSRPPVVPPPVEPPPIEPPISPPVVPVLVRIIMWTPIIGFLLTCPGDTPRQPSSPPPPYDPSYD